MAKLYVFDCGHTSPGSVKLVVYGVSVQSPEEPIDLCYCPHCQAQMTCQCGWCGNPIFPGESIGLYYIRDEARRTSMPPKAFVFDGKYVCCENCLEIPLADLSGKWVAPGEVKIVPLEELVDIRAL